MRPATDSNLRKRLAEFLEAQAAKDRTSAAHKAAAEDWIAATKRHGDAHAEVQTLLKQEPAGVTYDGRLFQLEPHTGRVVVTQAPSPQTALPLESA
jgi:thiamine monophosphate kinase